MQAPHGLGESSDSPSAGSTFILPPKNERLQASLEQVLSGSPFQELVAQDQLAVALVDLSDSRTIRYAGVDDDRMRYAASLPKIAILLAAFDQVENGNLTYTPRLKRTLEKMIRYSSNAAASQLISLIGFERIADTLRNPHYRLYDPNRNGGLWVGKGYGGVVGRWVSDPLHHISHAATARQVARFFIMLDQGMLVNPRASAEMKDILSRPAIQHKFVKGLSKRPGSVIYRKSGTWKTWNCDAALVVRDHRKYVAVALLESSSAGSVLSDLILKLDDIIHQGF